MLSQRPLALPLSEAVSGSASGADPVVTIRGHRAGSSQATTWVVTVGGGGVRLEVPPGGSCLLTARVSLQGIFHFQLGRGEPMLHTRVRPHCREFLEKIARLYELHVFTFGSRLYAHTIAGGQLRPQPPCWATCYVGMVLSGSGLFLTFSDVLNDEGACEAPSGSISVPELALAS